MMKFKKTIFNLRFVLLLIFLWAIVASVNYQAGTWLIGWDTLLPEFNFSLNLRRSLIGTWQEYQGLGVTGGMAHNADLIRQLFLAVLDTVIPSNLIRYIWHFLMLLVGPLGVYRLCLYLFEKKNTKSEFAALTASLFYLFNLAAVQYFFVPYEAFSSFYGWLPWVVFGFINYLDQPKSKNLLLLGIIGFISSPAYYVQTLFVVLIISLMVFAFRHVRQQMTAWQPAFNACFKGFSVIFVVSLFWLLPAAYFTITSVGNTVHSHQNILSTPELKLQNEGSGGLLNIVTLRGYWFNYVDFELTTGKTQFLFDSWNSHLQHPVTVILSVVLFCFGLTGLILVFSDKEKNKWAAGFLGLLLLSLLMLTSGKGLLGLPFKLASEYVPLFGQIFRTSFTKWSIVTALCLSVGLGYVFIEIVERLRFVKKGQYLFFIVFLIGFFQTTLPVFSGQLFYDRMQLDIPDEYFSLFNYLQNQDLTQRIIHLPTYNFWGWQFNDWGYRGSGFLWYGIEQPIVDRNFDTWGPTNERLYLELNYALKNRDSNQLSEIFQKYDIGYVLIDKSISHPNVSSETDLIQQQLKQVLAAGGQKEWQQGSLILLSVSSEPQFRFVDTKLDPAMVDYSLVNTRKDVIYSLVGNYISLESGPLTFPFYDLASVQVSDQNIITQTQPVIQKNYDFLELPGLYPGKIYSGPAKINYRSDRLIVEFTAPGNLLLNDRVLPLPRPANFSVEIGPSFENLGIELNDQFLSISRDESLTVWIESLVIGQEIEVTYFDADEIYIDEDVVKIHQSQTSTQMIQASIWDEALEAKQYSLPAELNEISLELKINSKIVDLPRVEGLNCDPFERGEIQTLIKNSDYQLEADSFGALCLGIRYRGTATTQDHWLTLIGANRAGRPMKFFVETADHNIVVLEDLVPDDEYKQTYFLPGYENLTTSDFSLNLNTRSLGGEQSIDELNQVQFHPASLPIDWLRQINLYNEDGLDKRNRANEAPQTTIGNLQQFGTGIYTMDISSEALDDKNSDWLVLSQSFDSGWIGLSWTRSLRIDSLTHQKFNGWANAWELPSGQYQVFLIYWPQLLTFAGFILLIGLLVYLAMDIFKRKGQI